MKVFTTAIFLIATPALADFNFARKVGDILAAEETCGFEYNQTALLEWIGDNISEDNGDFASQIGSTRRVKAAKQSQMTETEKSIFCAQHERFLKTIGVIA